MADILNIKSFRSLAPFPSSDSNEGPLIEEIPRDGVVLELTDVFCSNGPCINLDKMVLKNIKLKVRKGDFVSLIGRVGSGKTTFLDCIAGQTTFSLGKVVLKEEIGYVVEDPVIFSGTLKQNILLNK